MSKALLFPEASSVLWVLVAVSELSMCSPAGSPFHLQTRQKCSVRKSNLTDMRQKR